MVQFQKNVPLSQFSSYKIGGPAKFFFEAKTQEEIKEAVDEARRKNLKIFILGGGTNILISEEGFGGLVLKVGLNFIKTRGASILGRSMTGVCEAVEFSLASEASQAVNVVEVGAGVLMSDLLDFCIENGLSGLEWAGGLPGTLGGAIRGNAGAFGGEIKDVAESVKSFDVERGKEIRRDAVQCGFGYRSSIFKEKGGSEIILSAVLRLKEGDPKKIKSAIDEKIEYRKSRHPLEYPNVGSIFKNVDLNKVPIAYIAKFEKVIKTDPFLVVPAAFLISEAGLKGVSFGGAMISPKHPNFIVNTLGATSDEVKNLIALVKGVVRTKFNVELEEEVQII